MITEVAFHRCSNKNVSENVQSCEVNCKTTAHLPHIFRVPFPKTSYGRTASEINWTLIQIPVKHLELFVKTVND